MLYPLYVWKDSGSAYGATFPDLPGVNTAADEVDALNRAAQEAVELIYEGDSVLPHPAAIEQWAINPAYVDGFWMLI